MLFVVGGVAALLVALPVPAAAAAEPLVLGAEDAAGPWGGPDGKGCGNEIVAAAYKAAGVPVELRTLPYARAKAMTISGDLVGCFAVSPDASVTGAMLLSQRPLYRTIVTVFQNLARPLAIAPGPRLPLGAYVGVVRGYEYPPEIDAMLAQGLNLDPGPSETVNLEKLAAGRLDAAVVNLDRLKNEDFLLQEAGVAGKVGSVFAVSGSGSFVGFSVRNPRGRYAKQAFDKGYDMITASGEYERILQRWLRSP